MKRILNVEQVLKTLRNSAEFKRMWLKYLTKQLIKADREQAQGIWASR